MLFRLAALLSRVLPAFDFPETIRKQIDLSTCNRRVSVNEYLTFSLVASLVFSFSAAFFYLYAVPLVFVCSLVFFLRYPVVYAKQRGKRIEAELPVVLRAIATQLDFGGSFEFVLSESARESSGELRIELKRVCGDIAAGASPVTALNSMAARVNSVQAKRFVMQLVFCFEHGGSSDYLRNLASELVEGQKNEARRFNAQANFFGLLFISLSTIVPALYSAYLIVGSYFLEITLTPSAIFLSFVLFFPLLDLAVLLYLKERKPVVLSDLT
ncbi:MAG: type II secretion system F family protein [Candidatus Micrarchaeota archaeon]